MFLSVAIRKSYITFGNHIMKSIPLDHKSYIFTIFYSLHCKSEPMLPLKSSKIVKLYKVGKSVFYKFKYFLKKRAQMMADKLRLTGSWGQREII